MPKYQESNKVKKDADIVKLREQLGLPLIIKKLRSCLRCSKDFLSDSPTDRTCYNCLWYIRQNKKSRL
jgi:hypothetical protein